MHILIVHQTSPLMVVGFMFFAYSMLGLSVATFLLYKRSEEQGKMIKALKKQLKPQVETE